MKTKISITIGLLLSGLLFMGCSGDGYTVVPVSGTVTMDGIPEAGVKVVLSPLALEDNPAPGPYSSAITDENGEFVLETRYGKPGAIVGPHMAIFKYVGGNELKEGIAMAEARIEEAKAARDSAALSKAKAELKKLKEAPKGKAGTMPSRYYGRNGGIDFEVPKGGDEAVKFALTSE